jgi:hypothetical protein
VTTETLIVLIGMIVGPALTAALMLGGQRERISAVEKAMSEGLTRVDKRIDDMQGTLGRFAERLFDGPQRRNTRSNKAGE